MNFNTPILFVVFKRPDTTLRVFEEIRKIKPKKLYIAADGCRSHIIGEEESCLEVRKIVSNIDWDCDVKFLFRDENLGSALNVTKAINWVFEFEEKCIVLEDDTLPSDSFWYFMEEMLERYKNETSIMQINGLSPYKNIENYNYSYTFSKCLYHCWGWGTWKRSWDKLDFSMSKYESFMNSGGMKVIIEERILRYLYTRNFLKHKFYLPKSWDGRWVLSCLVKSGLAIVPTINMVINLGLNHQYASHTTEGEHSFEKLKLQNMVFPIKHPGYIYVDPKLESNGLYSFFNISVSKILKILIKKPSNELSAAFSYLKNNAFRKKSNLL